MNRWVYGTQYRWGRIAIVVLYAATGGVNANAVDAGLSASLQAKYVTLQDQLTHNQFQKPLYLESNETRDAVMGDIYALVDYRFAMVTAALNSPKNWCDILILHINTKHCRVSSAGQGDVLNVRIGKKYDQPLDEAYAVTFAYRVTAETSTYLQVRLNAAEGPLSTRNYRIILAAVPLQNGQTFIHLSYSYAYGLTGWLAMKVYLGTIGKNKIGFTVAGTHPDGQPRYIRGIRGVVERNSMRYYMAIEAFLSGLSEPVQTRVDKRLNSWFAAIERYPRQLHELEQSEYLEMKRKEHRRQQAG